MILRQSLTRCLHLVELLNVPGRMSAAISVVVPWRLYGQSIARELAHAAFEQTITLDIPWTDWTGRRHDKTAGRPVAMHAMRGISEPQGA